MDLFKLVGKIFIDSSQANEDIDKTTDKAKEAESKFGKTLGKIGKAVGTVGKVAVAGVTAGATAMTALTVKAMNAAGELEQNMGGSEAVFGQYAKSMQDTAKQAFSNMGLSTSDFLATANKMGALFKGAGFDMAEASDLTAQAMQRAADVASIMGISTESAMESIAGAAKGNFTMMDNLGVAMNETNLQAYALSKGIEKSTSEMTQQEKIGLAMEMFLEQTAYAAGNYAKENETLAGTLSTAKAALDNFLSGAGDVNSLVGALVGAGSVITKKLTEMLPQLVTGLQQLITQIMPFLPPMIQQLLPVIISSAVSLVNGLVSMLPEILSSLVAVIPMLLDGIATVGQALVAALPPIVMAIAQFISDPGNVQMIAETGITLLMSLVEIIPEIGIQLLAMAPQLIYALIQGLWNAAETLFLSVFNLGKGVVDKFKEVFGIGGGSSSVMQEQGTALAKGVESGLEGLPEAANATFSAVNANITSNVAATKDQVSADFAQIGDEMSNVSIGAGDGVAESFGSMRDTVSGSMASTSSEVTSKAQEIKTTMDSQLTATETVVSDKFQAMQQTIGEKMAQITETVKSGVETIKAAFNVDLKFRSVVVPKFRLSGKFDAENGKVPTVHADPHTIYFAEGGIVDQATIFGMLGNRPMVAGEKGKEAIAPIDTLQGYVSQAVASQNAGLIDVLDRILNAIVSMDENMGENMKDALDGTGLTINKREFGRMVRGVLA